MILLSNRTRVDLGRMNSSEVPSDSIPSPPKSDRSPSHNRRVSLALVLGGGGITGAAWETGLVKGLREAGTDLTGADLIVGTSAGAVVGAVIATGQLDASYERQTGPVDPAVERVAVLDMSKFANALGGDFKTPSGEIPQPVRARIGQLAISAQVDFTEQDRLRTMASRLGVDAWPDRHLMITAVACDDGCASNLDEGLRRFARGRRCFKLRRAVRLLADHNRRPPVHGWWSSVGDQCRPGARFGPRCSDRPVGAFFVFRSRPDRGSRSAASPWSQSRHHRGRRGRAGSVWTERPRSGTSASCSRGGT